MAIKFLPLPYAMNALDPYMSAQTLEYHHGKHHKAYVETLNGLIAGTPLENAMLTDIITGTYRDEKQSKIFNNAAQSWNHNFFWLCLKPGGGGKPEGELLAHIEQAFDSFDNFREKFKETATAQFGSGWAWLVADGDKLKIIKTPNAINPVALGQTALLTCDVWEHAYYLDYQNRRADMVQAFLDHLVNWSFVAANLAQSKQIAAS